MQPPKKKCIFYSNRLPPILIPQNVKIVISIRIFTMLINVLELTLIVFQKYF